MEEINIDHFMQIDLRIAKVINAEMVEKADKLIKLELDLGDLGKKTVFAGIKKAYSADNLKDKLVVCVNNLKSREMRFGISEGMILAAGDDDDIDIFIVSPDKGATPGMRVR
jgi:methionyl-tRNA synthetase